MGKDKASMKGEEYHTGRRAGVEGTFGKEGKPYRGVGSKWSGESAEATNLSKDDRSDSGGERGAVKGRPQPVPGRGPQPWRQGRRQGAHRAMSAVAIVVVVGVAAAVYAVYRLASSKGAATAAPVVETKPAVKPVDGSK